MSKNWFPRLYFGRADVQMIGLQSDEEFRAAIIRSILFDGNLVIPDAFWFFNKQIVNEVMTAGEDSLLLEGLKQGFIRPCFREKVAGSFVSGLRVMRDQGIIGLMDEAERVAGHLDNALRERNRRNTGQWTSRYRYIHWPENRMVGVGFRRKIETFMIADMPPVVSQETETIWNLTKRWRVDCVEEAIGKSQQNDLRRGELYDAVGRSIGWDEQRPIPNAQTLLAIVPKSQKQQLSCFVHWVNQQYQSNQAEFFGLESLVPTGSAFEQLGVFDRANFSPASNEVPALHFKVEIPSFRSLGQLPVRRVLSIRKRYGNEFLRAYRAWRNTPGRQTANLVADCLDEYANVLRANFMGDAYWKDGLEFWLGLSPKKIMERAFLEVSWWLLENLYLPLEFSFVMKAGQSLGVFLPNINHRIREMASGAREEHLISIVGRRTTKSKGEFSEEPISVK